MVKKALTYIHTCIATKKKEAFHIMYVYICVFILVYVHYISSLNACGLYIVTQVFNLT